jgi:hypothetical protein
MANPTAQVPSPVTPYSETVFKHPVIGGATVAKTYQNGEMIGLRADGYCGSFDDTVKMRFLGLLADPPVVIDASIANGATLLNLDRPNKFEMPLLSGTVSLATDFGKTLYAADSGHCTLSGGAFANAIGTLVGVSGVNMPNALTGAIAVIKPFAIENLAGGGAAILASTAAAGTTVADAGQLPTANASGSFFPTTAADDTKGVKIAAADAVAGRILYIGNSVAAKILKIYAPAGGLINTGAIDAAFSTAAGKGATLICTTGGAASVWTAY